MKSSRGFNPQPYDHEYSLLTSTPRCPTVNEIIIHFDLRHTMELGWVVIILRMIFCHTKTKTKATKKRLGDLLATIMVNLI